MRPEERFSSVLAHIAIVISGMYTVLYMVDKFNASMEFLTNNITKTLLLFQMAAVIYLSVYCIRINRRLEKTRSEIRNNRIRQKRKKEDDHSEQS